MFGGTVEVVDGRKTAYVRQKKGKKSWDLKRITKATRIV